MEDGGSSSPQHADHSGLLTSSNFPAFFQRASMLPQGSFHSTSIQSSESLRPGPYAPSPLRLTSISAIPSSNHNQTASQYSDGHVPATSHHTSGMQDMTPQPLQKKRGRPRKYAEGTGGSISSTLSAKGLLSPARVKPRGRLPGSGKKQQLAALGAWLVGSAGQSLTPHVITVAAGEDVATKIMSFSQTSPRAVCVLSANGAISNVTLRQPASSGGAVTYEGRFEILSLTGSFLLTEKGGTRSRTGGLSVSLAGPDGHVVGGGVAGMLMAATPVQVVVGSFITEVRKTYTQLTSTTSEPTSTLSAGLGVPSPLVTPLSMVHPLKAEALTPKSSSPLDINGTATSDNIFHPQGHGATFIQAMSWAGSHSMAESKNDREINMSLPDG